MKRKLAVYLSSLSLLAGVQNKNAESLDFVGTAFMVFCGGATVYEAYNVPRNLIKQGYKNYNKIDLILDTLIGIAAGYTAVIGYTKDIYIYGFNGKKKTKEQKAKDSIAKTTNQMRNNLRSSSVAE